MGTSAIPAVSPGGLALTIATADSASTSFSGAPENPTGFQVFVTFKRWTLAPHASQKLADTGSFDQVFEERTLTLTPTHFEYTTSVTAMSELRITVPDPEYELIDHLILEEDLATTVTVRFGYPEGSNMSDQVEMVFYKQEPRFPAGAVVETTLVCYDHMIFFTLPFEPTTTENPQGVTLDTIIQTVAAEVSAAYGQTINVEFDDNTFDGSWWRMHKVGREHVRVPSLHRDANGMSLGGHPYSAHTRIGAPLTFLYGLLAIASAQGTDARIELFVENGTLFFRPSTRRSLQYIASYRYFSELDSASTHPNRLLSFEPEVVLKPRMMKFRDMDPVTGEIAEASADPDTPLARSNLTKKQNEVRRVSVDTGNVQAAHGTVSVGDMVGKQVNPTPARHKTYTVKPGDNLDGIARKLRVSADYLIQWNHLTADGSTDRAKVVLVPGRSLTYQLPAEEASTAGARKNPPTNPQTVVTPTVHSAANRAYLTDEYEGVTAKATVEGDPALKAGWPIYIDNVGRRWSGPWYIEECKHLADTSGYTCDLKLSRDGFMIARDAGNNPDYEPKTSADGTDPNAPVSAKQQEKQLVRRVDVQGGGSTTGKVP